MGAPRLPGAESVAGAYPALIERVGSTLAGLFPAPRWLRSKRRAPPVGAGRGACVRRGDQLFSGGFAFREELARSLRRVPPACSYCVESGP